MEWLVIACLLWIFSKVGKKKSHPAVKTVVLYNSGEKADIASKWHKKNESVTVKGYIINGLIYTGKAGGSNHVIDPSLKVIDAADAQLERLNYWPSYSHITPQQRDVYLKFLASGACIPNTELGYVFLYFYGLETRLFKDEALSEYDDIVGEVHRLRAVFLSGDKPSGSFDVYSKTFLASAFILKHKNEKLSELIDYNSPDFQTSQIINICISELVEDDKIIPAELILKWIRASYYCSRISYTRTKNEYDKLFVKLFNKKYPNGFRIKTRKTGFTPEYKACSGNFRKTIYKELPLVVTESFYNQFDTLINECCNMLDEYSRHLCFGKSYIEDSLYSKVILPETLVKEDIDVSQYITKIRDDLADDSIKVISFAEFANIFKNDTRVSKREYDNIASFHNNLGLGLIPSTDYGDKNPKPTDNIIIFELPDKKTLNISQDFVEVRNIVDLAVAVANADAIHASELRIIHNLIDSYKSLSANETAILKKRIVFLERNPSYLRDIKSKLKSINQGQKRALLNLLISIVLADGKISIQETKILKSIYSTFGYDKKQMYGDLHQFQTEQKDEPVLVSIGSDEATLKIPQNPKMQDSVLIDMEIVNKKRAETKNVAEVLSDIFRESEPEHIAIPKEYQGMQGNLGEFFAILITQKKWQKDELENHAKKNSLFLGSALEKINDWSLENHEDTIVDDEGDTLTVNKELVA